MGANGHIPAPDLYDGLLQRNIILAPNVTLSSPRLGWVGIVSS